MIYYNKLANDLADTLSLKLENEGLHITKPMARAFIRELSAQFYYNDAWYNRYGDFKTMINEIPSNDLYKICKKCKLSGYRGL